MSMSTLARPTAMMRVASRAGAAGHPVPRSAALGVGRMGTVAPIRRRRVAAAAGGEGAEGADEDDASSSIQQAVFKRRMEMQYIKEKVQDAVKDANECKEEAVDADCAVEWDTVHELKDAYNKKAGIASVDFGEGGFPGDEGVENPKRRTREEEIEWQKRVVSQDTNFDPNKLPKVKP
mmetsp:Transcript_69472/g.219863  ORF Transcript_69472/g.219863 Transcript_69472/m.219863 type:complete len:178 (-) Transcript_69472:645-1178(-)